MSLLSRLVFREISSGAILGVALFTFVLFLERVTKLFELLVRASAPPETVAKLFAFALPPTLTFAVPVGVLVGVLIGLSRMSSDSEVIALRAAGVPSRRVLGPVLGFALLGMAVCAAATTWLTPLAYRESTRIINQLAAAQLTAEIQPRVFEEQFPNTILYVGDVIPGKVVRWRNVFLADLTEPAKRQGGARAAGEEPRITVADEAVAVPDVSNNRLQLELRSGVSHEVGADPAENNNTMFGVSNQLLAAQPPREHKARPYVDMDMGPLWRARHEGVDARIEFHRRLALPLACVLLALVGVPLGVSSRRGGKSGAFVLTVALALSYYTGLISLLSLAQQGTLPAWLAVWLPNGVLVVLGAVFLARLERPGDRDLAGSARQALSALTSRLQGRMEAGGPLALPRARWVRVPFLSQVIDTYVLRSFLFYFALLLASFVLITEVFTFFELLGDMVRNRIPMAKMLTYLLFLAPKLVYDSTPVSVLVAVLVTFGVMAKQNEVTAFKACGVSLHRLGLPVLLAAAALSGGLFAFDHYYVPEANRIQDGLRGEIKGRRPATYLRPDRRWIFGSASRIYYYRYFDPGENEMLGVQVYELDPATFRLRRHISAERARWEPALRAWTFQNGWSRDIDGVHVRAYRPFPGQTVTYPELNEPPSHFLKEVKQDKQMNFRELRAYIQDLRQSGFDTVRLQVQYHKKFAVPVFALIMAMISVPFAFLVGNRGAMAGVGFSLGIAVAYWAVSNVFEQVGYVNELPAALAAWSPAALFFLAGSYLLARMRT